MGLSLSYYMSHEFYGLAKLSRVFLIDFFSISSFTLGLLIIEFYNFFFYGIILVS